MAYQEHLQSAKEIRADCAVITLSDTRDESTDKSGARIKELLTEAGHSIALYRVIRDEPRMFGDLLRELLADPKINAILTNGGTGISKRDATVAVVESHLDQRLPGFGELFRMLSYEQVGSGAMLSRAAGGIANGKVIFAMPGSTKAVELAMTRLILPEIQHLLYELQK